MDAMTTLVILIGGLFVIGLLVNKKLNDLAEKQKPDKLVSELLRSFDTRSQEQTKEIRKQTQALNERLDNSAKIIGNVQKNIGEMSEIGRGMRELQEFLQSPKLRGNIGEQVLKDLVQQTLPKGVVFLQHSFKSGEKVDVAIKTRAGILPIDSKFPMENFQKMIKAKEEKERESYKKVFMRDIKKHLSDISKKYILPEEGTMDFALMYVPSEAVYYEVVNEPELMEMAQKSRVYPVSPTTLYAHLQTILLSFEGQRLNQEARRVFVMLRAVQKDYEKVDDNLSTLQRHLNNAYNMLNNVLTSFTHLGQKIVSTQTLGEGTKEEQKELEG